MLNRRPILFLENELARMEDLAFLLAPLARKRFIGGQDGKDIEPIGIIANARKLRSFLRGVPSSSSIVVEDFDNHILNEGQRKSERSFLTFMCMWCQSSRKAFVVTDELKDLLLGMSFGDLTWTDLALPHKAFALEFETPFLLTDDDSLELAAVSIAIMPDATGAWCLNIRGHRSNVLAYHRLSEVEKNKLRRSSKNIDALYAAWEKHAHAFKDMGPFSLMIPGENLSGLKIVETEDRFSVDYGKEYSCDELYRLIAGFCFYLQTLPPGSPHRSQWTGVKNFGKPDPNAITNGAEICMVSSSVTLTSEERKAFGGEGRLTDRELSAHFRRGHFRRAPGTGDDPNAPKVVLVRPTLVRKDRLQTGELVGGSQITTK